MPKKKNFLGGMQNYNPANGEYEPALKGPNGESPSESSGKSAFDSYNDKRIGKSKGLGYDPRNREESTKNHNKIINELNDKYGRDKISKQEYHDSIDREVDRWNNEQQYWYEHEDTPYDKDVANQQEQRRKEFADNLDSFEDEIDNAEKELMTSGLDEEEFAEKIDLFKKELNQNYGAIGEDDYNRLKEKLDRLTKPKEEKDESFDTVNKKRMGKENKSHKSAERKDKYGNPLVSDDAFKVGQKVAKEYLDQLNKGEGFETAKKSFVTLDGFRDAISDALEQEGLNPDYDLTYQDLNEIIGSVTGEEVDFEDYEGGGKGWTGKKYNGYIPQENKKSKLPF